MECLGYVLSVPLERLSITPEPSIRRAGNLPETKSEHFLNRLAHGEQSGVTFRLCGP
jgi:hypothetical protein